MEFDLLRGGLFRVTLTCIICADRWSNVTRRRHEGVYGTDDCDTQRPG